MAASKTDSSNQTEVLVCKQTQYIIEVETASVPNMFPKLQRKTKELAIIAL
jgi:hypothetical protein